MIDRLVAWLVDLIRGAIGLIRWWVTSLPADLAEA